jgi:hypothetical protein
MFRGPTKPRLTVLTAADPSRLAHFGQLTASVNETRLALKGLQSEIEWIVALDGTNANSTVNLSNAIVIELGVHQGVAAARNHALVRSSGHWIMPVDADDTLAPRGVMEAVRSLVEDDSIAWLATNRVLLSDHSPTKRWISEARKWAPRELEENWTSPFPFHPNNMIVNRDLAMQAGGWPGLGVLEDLAFCLAVGGLAPGLAVPITTVCYRKWEHQVTAASTYKVAKEGSVRVIEAMVNARRASDGLDPIVAPQVTHYW